MIILYHKDNKVVGLSNDQRLDNANDLTVTKYIVLLAKKNPGEILLWCHVGLKEYLNFTEIENLFHHKKLLLSFNPFDVPFLDAAIGYIDPSHFVQINKKVTYPTWQMSSAVGGIHAEVLLALNNEIHFDKNFDYFLSSLAKLSMPKGLLCYSEPRLLKHKIESVETFSIKSSPYTLFRFVKQHNKTQWVWLLLLNLMVYERNFPFLPFAFSFFYKNRTKLNINLDGIKVESSLKVVNKATVDVIIPTIGRKKYLYDVLKDLKAQTHLPSTVIIVEQNPDQESKSELDYLTTEEWPFIIKHTFTHQAGACNARNIALKEINSEWVFFADDDIRFGLDLIQNTLNRINNLGVKAVSLRCFQKGDKPIFSTIFQWISFGSGCSFVRADAMKNCTFKMGYEFGFGEDGDFGMQLRHQGQDVLYLPEPEILHLKAPMGGFRTKPVLKWHNDNVQPKPSPTVMLYQKSHSTRAQINSYKMTLFFKYYKAQKIKNPIQYYTHFQKQWTSSVFWANELKKQNEI